MNMDTSHATVMMFSGLGSETFQMGRDLFERNQVFRASMLELDQTAQQFAGHSVLHQLYEPSQNGQPCESLADSSLAVYMLQFAMAQTLRASGIEPDCTLAVSMGFFAAATVSGCMKPEEAMQALIAQARTVEMCCPRGGMLAVLAPIGLFQDPSIDRFCEVAAINSPSHFVVAGDRKGLDAVEDYLRYCRIACQRLKVEYGFHSHWIDDVRLPLEKLLAGMAGRSVKIPIVCCARAGRIGQLTAECFWKIAREPIRFYETIVSLEQQGTNLYIDAGPAGSLAAVLKGVLSPHSRSLVMSTLTPFHNEEQNLEDLLVFKRRSQQRMTSGHRQTATV